MVLVCEFIEGAITVPFVFRNSLPCLVSFLFAGEYRSFVYVCVCLKSGVDRERLEFGRSAVDVAIRADAGQSRIEGVFVFQQSASDFYGVFPRIEGAEGIVEFGIRTLYKCICLNIEGCSECASTIGRCTDTSLYLNTFNTGSEVGQVHKKGTHAFGIIERYPIQGDIDTLIVRSPNAHRRITYPCSGIGANDYTRSLF